MSSTRHDKKSIRNDSVFYFSIFRGKRLIFQNKVEIPTREIIGINLEHFGSILEIVTFSLTFSVCPSNI